MSSDDLIPAPVGTDQSVDAVGSSVSAGSVIADEGPGEGPGDSARGVAGVESARRKLAGASPDPRFGDALAAIDAANGEDPFTIEWDGEPTPKELVHAHLMTQWVRRLDAGATDLQLLAARAHHLRRWSSPRADFPDGRAGYLRWRAALKVRHAQEVGTILEACGYGPDDIARVQTIVRKEGLGHDAAVQTHEDALCLTFIQTQQFRELAERLDDDKIVTIVRKTLHKMSPAGIQAALTLPLSAAEISLIERATATPDQK